MTGRAVSNIDNEAGRLSLVCRSAACVLAVQGAQEAAELGVYTFSKIV